MALVVDEKGTVKANPNTGAIMGGNNSSGGVNVQPYIQNLLNYKNPVNSQTLGAKTPTAMPTVTPAQSAQTALSDPSRIAAEIKAANGTNGGVYGTPKTSNPNTPSTSIPTGATTQTGITKPTGDGTSYKTGITIDGERYDETYDIGGQKVGQASYHRVSGIATPLTGQSNSQNGNTPNMTPPGTQPQGETPTPNGYVQNVSGGGSYSGGGGYGSAAAILSQLGGGTGLTGLGTGTGTGTGTSYVPIAQGTVTSPEAAAAYAQLLQQAGYDLSQPLSNIELPNRVDLPQEVALPENFDFQRAWDQAADVDIGRINHVDTHPEEEMLGQITDLQSQQAILNADNTVKNGIVELQRVMQDAQKQYQDQRNQISMDEQRALDNQALYNEARGDRGGIGQAQYNTIQNTAATNRMTVQQEQTQLATDTARQIADLRSQGEFEKANQLLNISQKYLSELMDLYQWAKETNVGIDEFNLQVAQWEENFKLSLIGAELDADAFNLNVANAMMDQQNNLFNARFNQENSLFDARLNAAKLQNDEAAARLSAQLNAANATGAFANGTPTYTAQQDAIANQLKERQLLADVGTTLIKEGIQPSEAILNAMGMGGMAATGTGEAMAGTLSGVLSQLGYSDATSALRAMGIGSAGLAGIAAMGMTPEQYLANALGVSTSVAGLPALGSTTATTVPSGAEQMLSQLEASPNYYSEVAAYSAPTVTTPTVTQPTGYSDANVYAAFGADPETVLRAMGVGNDGMAGLAYLGITPAQFIGQAFGL